MGYQKKMLDSSPNEPRTFKTKNWVETHDDTGGTYNTNSQFKNSMLKSSLCGYSDAYILVKELYQSQNKQEITKIITIKK